MSDHDAEAMDRAMTRYHALHQAYTLLDSLGADSENVVVARKLIKAERAAAQQELIDARRKVHAAVFGEEKRD